MARSHTQFLRGARSEAKDGGGSEVKKRIVSYFKIQNQINIR
jgi:hypothetical protein